MVEVKHSNTPVVDRPFQYRDKIEYMSKHLPQNKSIRYFEKSILDFYHTNGRKHLPWRGKQMTPYKVWVSEIMLQQTQVDRVIDFYTKFLSRFPTIQKLAQASWEEFLLYYQGLGYYNRGRNMLKAAQMIVEQYEGRFPKDIKGLERIPGIGKYTARAILSFGSNVDHLAWDTNFQRVFGRFFLGTKDAEMDSRNFEGKIFADKRDFNGAIMDFGSLICTKKPKCGDCLLRRRCVYFKQGGRDEITKRKLKESFPYQEASVWVFLHKEHKVYYSLEKSAYSPFQLSKTHNTREGIKRYFQENHGLEVSVRPAHKRIYIRGTPVLFVNAQILLGEYFFFVHTKEDVQKFLLQT